MAFARLEQEAWTAAPVAAAYANGFPSMVGFTVEPLLEAVGAGAGRRMLDLACGPGTVARMAHRRGARVTALDFSRSMLRAAGAALPEMHAWVLGRSEQLPFRNRSFDAIACNFGLLHFADPERAIHEAGRLLAPGGRLAFTVWGQDAVGLRLIPEALERLGLTPSLPTGPGFFAYGAPRAFSQSFERAGLVALAEQPLAARAPVASVDAYWRMFLEGSARTRASLLALSEADRERVRAEVAEGLGPYASPAGLSVPVTAVLGVAGRPAR
ncbi:MAG: methyltransferase domain-containing protein [Thermoplasmata archaeon]|nr:methyltransferase domain-containing protein [Thermoplasmata archaeon]MCI4337693.1 methyltransferase domain-containing protein [Thermoplasmata archaeon]MCI4340833.1 methyltransferase domain-containing protein [Thermoplasmata archaeon]